MVRDVKNLISPDSLHPAKIGPDEWIRHGWVADVPDAVAVGIFLTGVGGAGQVSSHIMLLPRCRGSSCPGCRRSPRLSRRHPVFLPTLLADEASARNLIRSDRDHNGGAAVVANVYENVLSKYNI